MIPLKTIRRTAELIQGHILQTPLVYSATLSTRFGVRLFLKLENLQKTGSFKIRGAASRIVRGRLEQTISSKGVVAASAGNHAQGVALAAREAGLPATIVMPQWSSISKREATRDFGGDVVIDGATVEESVASAKRLAGRGMTFIHPFDDPDIISGQATIGLEIVSDLPEVDVIIVPVGGGGLIAGIASAVKAVKPRTRIIGVAAAACPSAHAAIHQGRRVVVEAGSSIADGITVKQIGELPFPIIQQHVDSVVTVAEPDIAASIQILLDRQKVLAEGAGAVPLAALLNGSVRIGSEEKVVLLVSGGNVDSPLLGRIIHQGLVKNGRIMRIRLTLKDRPGTLAALLNRIAALEANILHIYHDRSAQRGAIDETRVVLELETRNFDHIRQVEKRLSAAGYVTEPTE